MPRTQPRLLPNLDRQLSELGRRLRLARLRRKMSAITMADRANVSRDTLHRAELGEASVSLGTYLRILRVLGLDGDLTAVARDDVLGRKLQDIGLPPPRERKPRKRTTESNDDEPQS